MRKKEDCYYLNDIEKDEVRKFAENSVAFNAVKKVILEGLYNQGRLEAGKPADPLKNFMLGHISTPKGTTPAPILMKDDKGLGEDIRALMQGVSLLVDGFETLESFVDKQAPEVKKVNKAR